MAELIAEVEGERIVGWRKAVDGSSTGTSVPRTWLLLR
jgi:hypothetical protein